MVLWASASMPTCTDMGSLLPTRAVMMSAISVRAASMN